MSANGDHRDRLLAAAREAVETQRIDFRRAFAMWHTVWEESEAVQVRLRRDRNQLLRDAEPFFAKGELAELSDLSREQVRRILAAKGEK